jgi:protein-S-isoprenylcysteine O-methyltransferase Ste14
MARPSFKAWWTRAIPEGLERSTYVLAACIAGFVMLMFWQPIPLPIWEVSGDLAGIAWALFALGWLTLLVSAINFGICELLGLTQAWAWCQGRRPPPPTLKVRGLYRLMPHPMYIGVMLGFWMTPVMTAGHLLIAAALTAYILIAMRYEERDLRRTFGGAYRTWRHARQAARPRS